MISMQHSIRLHLIRLHQTSASRKSLKDTEQQLKDVNEQIHFTGQYLAYKNVYADYRKSRNKQKFSEEHRAELSLYDTALRTLKANLWKDLHESPLCRKGPAYRIEG